MLLAKNLGRFYIAVYILTTSKIMATFIYLEQFNCSYYFGLFFKLVLTSFLLFIFITMVANIYRLVLHLRFCFSVLQDVPTWERTKILIKIESKQISINKREYLYSMRA
jgi:hypothetical protein